MFDVIDAETKSKIKSFGLTCLYVGGSAVVTFVPQYLAGVDLGGYQLLVMGALALAGKLIAQYVTPPEEIPTAERFGPSSFDQE